MSEKRRRGMKNKMKSPPGLYRGSALADATLHVRLRLDLS